MDFSPLLAAIVPLVYLAGFVAAGHAAMTNRTAQGAVAWTVSLVSFPFLALPAYLVFGRGRFSGMAEAFRQNREEADRFLETFRQSLAPYRVAGRERISWRQAVERLTGHEVLRGNAVDLLVDGEATFDSILAGVAEAREYILFQFYMIRDDELGGRVRDALVERARAGVRVYLLFDEVGSLGLSRRFLRSMTDEGIEVSPFRPTRGRGNRFQLNFRNHRKMVVVDGKTGWVGGLNVGDEYVGRHERLSPWRDTHLRVRGPVVLQLQLTVLADWYWATRENPEVNWTPTAVDPEPGATEGAGQHAIILPTGPVTEHETASLFFVAALAAAQERAWIAAPYFVPDDAVMKALKLAALRGVDVRILTTLQSDSLPVRLAAFHYRYRLRGLGIRFSAYAPGFMHQKVMLVDDYLSYVGSHNFDNRSFRLNFEVGAVVVDADFAREVAAMLERDFEHAQPLDPEDFEQRGLTWRLGVQLARLAAPLL
jgi:cardiolipin synthase